VEANEETRSCPDRNETRQPRPCGRSADDEASALEKAKPNPWASLRDWLNASAVDCPIGTYGITLYGTLDLNATYLHKGVEKSPAADKLNFSIQKNAYESKWFAGYSGLSASAIGLRMKEEILPYGWSLIFVSEAGVNPYSGMFANGPLSRVQQRAAREHISISERELRRQPRRSVGQLARLFGDQQGASGAFFTQITHSAPIEVFLSADVDRPQAAIDDAFAVPDSRFTYAIGKLVLWSRVVDASNGEAALKAANF
jgi:hypothetical protein